MHLENHTGSPMANLTIRKIDPAVKGQRGHSVGCHTGNAKVEHSVIAV